jgi:hypothetical protein
MVLSVSFCTLQRIQKYIMEKHHQLTVGKKGIHWAMARHKKGYSTISNELRTLLIVAFNDHPHVIVLPNTKDTLQVCVVCVCWLVLWLERAVYNTKAYQSLLDVPTPPKNLITRNKTNYHPHRQSIGNHGTHTGVFHDQLEGLPPTLAFILATTAASRCHLMLTSMKPSAEGIPHQQPPSSAVPHAD